MTAQNASSMAPRRAALKICGDCNLCCKVYEIEDFAKKPGHTCHHVRPHEQNGAGGCGIWGIHPKICQEFKCLWLRHDDMGPLWRPDVSGFVLRLDPNGTTLNIDVDHDRPRAWMRDPYYNQIKQWSEVIMNGEGLVLVYAPEGLYVISPEEDLFLKAPKRGDILETGVEQTLFGPRAFARVIPAKDHKKTAHRKAG